MRAIHLICHRTDGSLNNWSFEKETGIARSGKWELTEQEARSLIGGWMYLHPSKAARSEFGGVVVGFEPVVDESLIPPQRAILIVQSRMEGKGQRWRGLNHERAKQGGLLDGDAPHEMETVKTKGA